MENSLCTDPSLESIKCLIPAFLRNAGKRSDLGKADEMFIKFFSLNPMINIKCGKYTITDEVRSYNFTSGVAMPCKEKLSITLIEEDPFFDDKGDIDIDCGILAEKGTHVINTKLNDSLVELTDDFFPNSSIAEAFASIDAAYYSFAFEINQCCAKEDKQGILVDGIYYKTDGDIDSSTNNSLEANSCYASSVFLDTSFLLLSTIFAGTFAFDAFE